MENILQIRLYVACQISRFALNYTRNMLLTVWTCNNKLLPLNEIMNNYLLTRLVWCWCIQWKNWTLHPNVSYYTHNNNAVHLTDLKCFLWPRLLTHIFESKRRIQKKSRWTKYMIRAKMRNINHSYHFNYRVVSFYGTVNFRLLDKLKNIWFTLAGVLVTRYHLITFNFFRNGSLIGAKSLRRRDYLD